MLKQYKIIEEGKTAHCGLLKYNTDTDEYSIDIEINYPIEQLPAILAAYKSIGKVNLNNEEALRFVKARVIPAERQNIGQILRKIGVPYYSEFFILDYTKGRCCMDEFYLEEVA